ncbi:hypothetical protein PYJP_19940 [Pyrofollis japonicus]|uniref:hypothetical protein n=1 Tax=Pyrofollis japonicus TaxID=3060460 RepID=UPI00295B9D5D|nr:hypothetical protein [Pyrofollis japonicus]BEP18642.1 hypothetical protein PYJP_19940 [Pyrofollis japonicus]
MRRGEKAPLPALPDIEEKDLGVKEYWYETFRRVLILPLKEKDCYMLSIDVYKRLERQEASMFLESETSEHNVLSSNEIFLIYKPLHEESLSRLVLNGVKPAKGELVAVATKNNGDKRVEISDVRLIYCGLKGVPSYEDVRSIYNEVVRVIESRDPLKEPLDEIIERS